MMSVMLLGACQERMVLGPDVTGSAGVSDQLFH